LIDLPRKNATHSEPRNGYDEAMAFGRNPHVARAQAAEQKAEEAIDDAARTMARREAAHQWDRAAEREKPGKHKELYVAHASRNRALADGESAVELQEDATGVSLSSDPKVWN
jgi:hypothetical protein